MDSAGTEVATPWTPAATKLLTSSSCLSASPPSGPATWSSTLRSLAAALAPSTICWMNGLPMTCVTKPIFTLVAFGFVVAVAVAAAAVAVAVAAGGVGVAAPVQAATKTAVMAGSAHLSNRILKSPSSSF